MRSASLQTRWKIGLWALGLLACDPGTLPEDAGETACGPCPAERPYCEEAEALCVACEHSEQCAPPLLGCINGQCVSCDESADCASLDAPECYFGTHACRACTSDDACQFRPATPRCVAGRCTE